MTGVSAAHHRRRLVALALAALAIGAGWLAFGPRGSGSGPQGAATSPRLAAPPVDRPPVQAALGPLPKVAGVERVDLARPSLLGPLRLHPAPHAGLAFDLSDGSLLWRRGATLRRPIASLTKLMTALLAVERFAPDDLVRIPRRADQIGGSRMGGLKPGRKVRANVLLKGLLIASGNDAAVTLAIAGAGSERAWVALMNRRARDLGLTCTHYVDPHGLNPGDRSCAADLAVLAMRALAVPRIAVIAHKRTARVWTGSGRKLTLRTTNHLLRDRYPGAIGLKTGYTGPAGFCLVTVLERAGRRIGIVLLGSRDSFSDARQVARAAVRAGALAPAA
jgi:D-alanyl-D-alanine carboxypeptidase